MAAVCCDTSFLLSLYGKDASSAQALTLAVRMKLPITISIINEFEFENAVRLSVFRGRIDAASADAILASYATDKGSGRLDLVSNDLLEVLTQAKGLSSAYTQNGGHRPYDILHVAAAMRMGATEFLSFDGNQRKLARAVGLKVRPI